MDMKRHINSKKNFIVLICIINFIISLLVLITWLCFAIPSYVSAITLGIQSLLFTVLVIRQTNNDARDIEEKYMEPISILHQTVEEFTSTKQFTKKVKNNVGITEIDEILKGFSDMANSLSDHYTLLQTKSELDQAMSQYNASLIKLTNEKDIKEMMVETIKRLIPCDFGAVLGLENGDFVIQNNWNNLNTKRTNQQIQISSVPHCPSFRLGANLTCNEIYGNDGCKHCYPVQENRQSSLCYTFYKSGNPYMMIHLGSKQAHYFNIQHKEMLGRIEQTTNVRLKQIETSDIIEHKAFNDELTGLKNKRYISETLHQLIEEKKTFSIILFDIDKFKSVNDTYGHLIGDYVLQEVGKLIQLHLPMGSFGGRYGGEELLIVTLDPSYEQVIHHAEKMRMMIENHKFQIDQHRTLPITTSAGISFYPKDGQTYKDVFEKADKALYSAKNEGRNRIKFWSYN